MTLADSRSDAALDQNTRRSKGWGVLVLCVALFSIFAFAWDGLVSLPIAWSKDEYSHGYLIPVIAAYLLSRRIELTRGRANDGRTWPGLGLAILSLALVLLGNFTQIPDLVTYGLIAFLYSILLVCFGFTRGMLLWVPAAYLFFMLPLPNFIYLRLSIFLQLVSSEIGVWVIQFFGVPVFLEGNVIDLGVYKLQVAEACSGLRYLFPLTSFGFLFAALYRGPVWHKVIIFLSAVPITVLMNSFRIGMIGILVDRFGIEQADGFLHSFEGWVIFASCVSIIFLEVFILQRLSNTPRRIADTLDLELVPLRQNMIDLAHMGTTKALVALSTLVFLSAAIWLSLPERQFERVARSTFSQFPLALGRWSGTTGTLAQNVETVLGADDYFLAEYSSPDEALDVGVFMAFYHKLSGGSGIHSPEVSLPMAGWEVSAWTERLVTAGSGDNPASFTVNRSIIQRGLSRQLVYFWFEQNGRKVTSSYASKMYAIVDSIRDGRSDAGIVRLLTPIGPNESEADADDRLQRYLAGALPELSEFMPD